MTLLPRGVKVHLAFGYTDMRKGIDGHAGPGRAAAGSVLGPPFRVPGLQGESHQDRVLGWHWSLLPSNAEPGETLALSSEQLSMLIDGVDWRAPERRWRPAVAG